MKTQIITLLLLALMSSCSVKKESEATFHVSTSSLTAAMTNDIALGGAFLVAEEKSSGLTMGRVLHLSTSDDYTAVFPNGVWNFHIIAWEGGILSKGTQDGAFTGVMRCGSSTNVTLAGGSVAIDLYINNQNCDTPTFRGSIPSYNDPNRQYKRFRGPNIRSCRNLIPPLSAATQCQYDPGLGQRNKGFASSFRYILQDFDHVAGKLPVLKGTPIQSRCMRVDVSTGAGNIVASANTRLDTDMALPPETSFILGLRLRAYFNSKSNWGAYDDCGEAAGFMDIPLPKGTFTSTITNGIQKVERVYNNAGTPGVPSDDQTVLFVRVDENDLCKGGRLSPLSGSAIRFAGGYGSTGFPWLICDYKQLEFLANSFQSQALIRSGSYLLAKDINLWFGATLNLLNSGWQPNIIFPMIGDSVLTFPTNSNPYTGTFDGNGKKIIGLNIKADIPNVAINEIGFIRDLGNTGRVYDLTLIGPEVKAESAAYVGAIAGKATGYIQNVRVEHGEVEGKIFVGGIVGLLNGSPADARINKSVVRDVRVEAHRIAGGAAGAFVPGGNVNSVIDQVGVYKGQVKLDFGKGPPACVKNDILTSGACTSGLPAGSYWDQANISCKMMKRPTPGVPYSPQSNYYLLTNGVDPVSCASQDPDAVWNGSDCRLNYCHANFNWDPSPQRCVHATASNAWSCNLQWRDERCVIPDLGEDACSGGAGTVKWDAPQYGGGLVGFLAGDTAGADCPSPANTKISKSTAQTYVHGDSILGGLVGYLADQCSINDSYSMAKVKGENPGNGPSDYKARVGGLVGLTASNSSLTRVFMTKGSIMARGGEFSETIGHSLGADPTCTNVFSSNYTGGDSLCYTKLPFGDLTLSGTFVAWSNFEMDEADYYDVPRLAWEDPRPCSGKFGTITGSGTLGDPYLICNVTHFLNLDGSSSYFKLGSDIDFDEIYLNPNATVISSFTGELDGDGYSLLNYKLGPTASNIALFGTNGGKIKDLKIFGFESTAVGYSAIASLVVTNTGLIDRVEADVEVTADSNIGGLVVTNTGTIDRVNVRSLLYHQPVNGTDIGGLVASNQDDAVISHSRVYAKILFPNGYNFDKVGGVVAVNGGDIFEVHANLEVDISNGGASIGNIGGVAGNQDGTGYIHDVRTYVRVHDNSQNGPSPYTTYFGGIVGLNSGNIERVLSETNFQFHPNITSVSGYNYHTLANDSGGSISSSYFFDNNGQSKFTMPGWSGVVNNDRILFGAGVNSAGMYFAPNFPTYASFSDKISTDENQNVVWVLDADNGDYGPWLKTVEDDHQGHFDLISSWGNYKP